MTIRRPLESLAKIHPEHLARVRQEADARGRFFMAFDGTLERSLEGWAPYEAQRRPWRDGRITAKGFDPGFRGGAPITQATSRTHTEPRAPHTGARHPAASHRGVLRGKRPRRDRRTGRSRPAPGNAAGAVCYWIAG